MTLDPIAVARRLADILERENAALEALDIPRAMDFLDEKQRALEAWYALPSDSTLPAGSADHDLILRRLRRLVDDNRTLLRHALAVQMRVIAILAATMPRVGSVAQYGPSTRCDRPSAWLLAARA